MLPEVLNYLELIRNSQLELIQKLLPEPQASLLSGIVLGVKDNLSKDFREDLIATGTIHVVVVSGYNISVLAGIIAGVDKFIGKKIAFTLVLISILIYTLLTGAEPPTVRAAIMGLIVFGAKVIGRLPNSTYILFLTGFTMVLFDWQISQSISFQLSFLATLGILLLSEKLSLLFKFLPKIISENLSTNLSAQIFVFPVLIYYFGSISLISPLVNLLVLWTVPVSTILGFAIMLTGIISITLAKIISWFVWLPLTIFYQIVDNSANLPLAQVFLPKHSLLLTAGFYLIILGFLGYLNAKSSKPSDK